MSAKRAIMHLLLWIIGWSVSIPYLYSNNVSEYTSIMDGYHAMNLINIGMVLLLAIATRSMFLLGTNPEAWRDSGRLSNIEGLYAYRDARLKGMTNADGSILMRETQLLDASMNFPSGTESARVAGYMNSRLAGMTYEQGLSYLKLHRK